MRIIGYCGSYGHKCRHKGLPTLSTLRDKTDITDSDFEGARSVSVLSSLVTLKGMHYNKKMLLALTVCDLYSGHTPVSLNLRIAFETLMNAIEWPIFVFRDIDDQPDGITLFMFG